MAEQTIFEGDLVSIIMPVFNAENFIQSTIQSVLNQSYVKWELLVVDDFSKDKTCKLVRELADNDSRIRLICLDKNFGAPAAPRNIGVSEARGEWVAFLDADDIWHPRKLEIQLEIMNQESVLFSSTRSRNFVDEKLIAYPLISNLPSFEKITFFMQRLKGRIANSSVVCSKSLLMTCPFNEDFRYKAVEDYHCWLRIHSKIEYSLKINAVLLNYRISEGQISGSKLYMLRKIFMLHREFENSKLVQAVFYTLTHATGGYFNKFIRRGF